MKKRIFVVLALAFLVVIFVSACDISDSSDDETSEESSKTYLYDSLKDYINSNEAQADNTSNSTEEVTCSMTIESDNILVLTYTYVDDIDSSMLIAYSSSLQESLEEMDTSLFTEVKEYLETYVNVENPRVKMAYYTNEGFLLAEYEPDEY